MEMMAQHMVEELTHGQVCEEYIGEVMERLADGAWSRFE